MFHPPERLDLWWSTHRYPCQAIAAFAADYPTGKREVGWTTLGERDPEACGDFYSLFSFKDGVSLFMITGECGNWAINPTARSTPAVPAAVKEGGAK